MHAADIPRLNLITLRLFVAACEEQSISGAAMREHIAASALSRRLSELEAALGLTLFRRHKRGLEPTPSALVLLRHARIIMSGMAVMADELAEHSGGMRGTVRLHANIWAITQYLPDQLSSFLAEHPHVVVEVEESLTPATLKALTERTTDIGIIGGSVAASELRMIPYRKDRLVVIMPSDHALAVRSTLKLVDLVSYDFIGARVGSALDQLIRTGAAGLGATLKIRIRISGLETMFRLVEAGLGLGLVPSGAALRHSRHMNFAAVPLDEPWAERQLSICVATSQPLSMPTRMFLDHLQG
jgi:DNA-binding transcriptional LysR family regulator